MGNKRFAITTDHLSKPQWTANIWAYIALLVLAFCFFALYSNVTKMVLSPSKLDIFTKDLNQLATYFLPVDREVSQKLITLDSIVQEYLQGENVLQTKAPEIEELRTYIVTHRAYLSQLGFKNYDAVMNFLAEAYAYRDEVFLLLGKNQPFNYLVLLQNGNEKRPNGGFFGSFAFVTLEGGHIIHLEIIDSYLPDYLAPTTRIQLPSWFASTFGEERAGFIAGNKFGFTDMDGKNIKTLYEKIFNLEFQQERVEQMLQPAQRELLHEKYIKGVIFLDSDLLSALLPSFTEKAREWQFLNASIDLIRGEVRSNKKELYIQQVLSYFDANKFTLIKNLINRREEVLSKRYVHLFLSNTTPDLHSFLVQHHLNTPYATGNLYLWDVNTAFNKSDGFVTKSIQMFPLKNEGAIERAEGIVSSSDIVEIAHLSAGTYRLQIDYDFSVPEYYIKFIESLTKKYDITLTPREQDILVLGPVQYENKPTPRWRETRGIVYFPFHRKVVNVQGDSSAFSEFQSDFAKGLVYRVSTNQNPSTKQVMIDFEF
jgi:hypothetical protein